MLNREIKELTPEQAKAKLVAGRWTKPYGGFKGHFFGPVEWLEAVTLCGKQMVPRDMYGSGWQTTYRKACQACRNKVRLLTLIAAGHWHREADHAE